MEIWCGHRIPGQIHARKRVQPGPINEALNGVIGLDPIKAQIAVIYSETWRDQYERNVQLDEQFIEALIRVGQESGNSTITEKNWKHRSIQKPYCNPLFGPDDLP